jgi:hypothetical protein
VPELIERLKAAALAMLPEVGSHEISFSMWIVEASLLTLWGAVG